MEAAGIKWRGKHAWVSTANIAFTTGYTQQERERLVDVYMEKFKSIFGRYPKSVGSWFIDSHTLLYLYEKYHIVASSNCKDQVGTDGYTLWGGYWNQAYYPSKYNAYMPAQSKENQIPVPIFRMLGSDPIYQYDLGVGTSGQGVITLEPVYEDGGMDRKWTRSFFKAIVDQPSLAFNYAQAGQENSFTWDAMKKGLEMQFPIIDSLQKAGKVRVQTLEEAGRWFSEQFAQTPATAVVALDDYREQDNKSIWYNSRFYRANLYWEKNAFRFRDIHLFDEHFKSLYLNTPGTEGQFYYFTLPLVDGFFWSTKAERAGLRIMQQKANGDSEELVLQTPSVSERDDKTLEVRCADQYGNLFFIGLKEKEIVVRCEPKQRNLRWFFELKVPTEKQMELPFKSIAKQEIAAVFKEHTFRVSCKKGTLLAGNDAQFVFQVHPQKQQLALELGNR